MEKYKKRAVFTALFSQFNIKLIVLKYPRIGTSRTQRDAH
jgi:hypothetical protein